MGWTAGRLTVPFSSHAAIVFDLGEEFAERVIKTARFGSVIYAAVRSAEEPGAVFGLVRLAERREGLLFTKSIAEDMGPIQDQCPARILDLLTAPSSESAREWRDRCGARLSRPHPVKGQTVVFSEPVALPDGSAVCGLIFEGGSRFRSRDGALCRVPRWRKMDYRVED